MNHSLPRQCQTMQAKLSIQQPWQRERAFVARQQAVACCETSTYRVLWVLLSMNTCLCSSLLLLFKCVLFKHVKYIK